MQSLVGNLMVGFEAVKGIDVLEYGIKKLQNRIKAPFAFLSSCSII